MMRSKYIMAAGALLLAVAFGAAGGCFGTGKPGIELYENGVYHPETVRAYEISGARDGATTRATALFTLDDGDRVRVELEVSYNPTPELASGNWQREGKVSGEGDVYAESLKFLGGQGATPSVGGRFRLETYGSPRMRVVIPVRPLERAR